MAKRVPARLSRSEGRKFGLVVGVAFLALAAIVLWREKQTLATIFGTVGGLLVAAGLLVPTQLGPVQRGWMRFAHAISRVTTPIIMGIAYFLIILPIGLARRAIGRRLQSRPAGSSSYWVDVDRSTVRDMHRQF